MKLRSAAHWALPLALGLGLTATAWAQASGPSFMIGVGTVNATLNAKPVLPGTAVLPGDSVATAPGGVVVMTPSGGGGVVLMNGNSSAVLPQNTTNLQIQQGNALVAGNITVTTLQGTEFKPATGTQTTYVVNAGVAQSSMGVVTGSVSTLKPVVNNQPPPPPLVVPAGDAINVSTGANGLVQTANIKLNQVQRPNASDATPKQTPASQSQ